MVPLRLVMMGTGTFGEPTFEALIAGPHQVVGLVTQPDRPVGQERGSSRQIGRSLKNLALAKGIPVFQPENLNTPEAVEQLQRLQPDLLVVAAFGQILSRAVLAVARLGGINVHASLLPKYRGAAPVAWAIYHGETQTGVTIIRMSVSLDAGDVLAQEAIDILPEETAGALEARLAPLGTCLALRALDEIARGTVQGLKQDPAQATRAPKLKKEDGLIDWTRSPEQVGCQIRAMQPWPTAYTFLHQAGKKPMRVIIQRSSVIIFALGVVPPGPGTPGVAVELPPGSGRIQVATGVQHGAGFKTSFGPAQRFLEVLELQPAGKKRMSAAEFLRGHPLKPGDHFGPESA
jgi:methionyl-tRNA formyltransferase